MKLRSEDKSQTELAKIRYLGALDWELINADTDYYTHGYHPYSAKYIPQIPNRLISAFSKKDDLILDNFVGSGTTLVESKVLGRNAIGVDVNPLACLISKVKTTVIKESTIPEISHFLSNLRGETFHECSNPDIDKLHPNISKWYHVNVICELLAIKTKIDVVRNTEVKDFLLVAFSSLLRTVSNAKHGFGNLMIDKNAPPKNRIIEKFSLAVRKMLWSLAQFSNVATKSQVTIFKHDSRNVEFIKDETIDFICTHPPYMSAVPYAEYQKLSLWWLGYNQYDLEKSLIAGRRSRPDTPQRFLRDMEMSLLEMKRILRKKRYCCIVIGNPVYGGKTWKLNEIIKQNALHIGFTHLKQISRGKYHSTMGKMKEEFILIFRND
jgi:DNA modification methylase